MDDAPILTHVAVVPPMAITPGVTSIVFVNNVPDSVSLPATVYVPRTFVACPDLPLETLVAVVPPIAKNARCFCIN